MKKNTFYCGAAKRKITPDPASLKNLRGLSGVTFTGVQDDLFVRVFAVSAGEDKLLIITFDLDKVPCPKEFLFALTKETGIPEENISLIATHTHTAPLAGWRPEEGPNFILRMPEEVQEQTHRYEAFLQEQLLQAVSEALMSLVPAKLGFAEGKSYVNVCRTRDYHILDADGTRTVLCALGKDPSVPVDRRLFVLKAETTDGAPIAVLINYPVHNCVMIDNHLAGDGGAVISSDLGGNVCQMLEAKYPGMTALWTSGAAGDLNPVSGNQIFYPDPATGAPKQWIFSAKDEAPLMILRTLSAEHYDDVMQVLSDITCPITEGSVFGRIGWTTTPGKEKPFQVRVHLSGIRSEKSLTMAGFSGELYSSLGRSLIRQMPETSVVINHDASLLGEGGYIFDDETLKRDQRHRLPGTATTNMLPGTIKKALEDTVKELLPD